MTSDEKGFLWDFDRSEPPPDDLYLLKWEATDLYDFIWDVPDLSCIRGASELLADFARNGTRRIAGNFSGKLGVHPVYGNGDQYLAVVQGAPEAVAGFGEALVRECASQVFAASAFGFVRLKDFREKDLHAAIWQCEERILRQRLSSLNVAAGSLTAAFQDTSRDELDRLRLAEVETDPRYEGGIGTVTKRVSRRTKVRADAGKAGRWTLIREVAKSAGVDLDGRDHPYLQDLSALASDTRPWPGYIAYLAIDGNGSTRLREQARSLAQMRCLSSFLYEVQIRTFAHALRPEITDIEENTRTPRRDYAQPVQILFFAGDEGDMIVRGDRGSAVATSLMEGLPVQAGELLDRAEYAALKTLEGIRSLSCSIGLVIGHADTPIRLVRDSAHQLISNVKEARRSGRPDALVDFMVFESHVTTADTVTDYRSRHLRDLTRRPLNLDQFRALTTNIAAASRADLPVSQRHRIALALARKEPLAIEGYLAPLARKPDRMLEDYLRSLFPSEEDKSSGFLDFHELYDWVPVEKTGGTP